MQISPAGLRLIESFEGFRPTQYRDSVGVLTIGYGTTAADVNPLPHFLTQPQAAALLARKVDTKYAPAVNAVAVPLNQNQFDALCSLAYNLGPGVMTASYQIYRDLRAHNYRAAADDFLHYVYAGGERLQGLVNRRDAERALFLAPPAAPAPADPHHYGYFATGPFDSRWGPLNERDIVEKYDRLRVFGVRNRTPLEPVRAELSFLAGRIAYVAERDEPPSWDQSHRGWRYQQLIHRSQGIRFV